MRLIKFLAIVGILLAVFAVTSQTQAPTLGDLQRWQATKDAPELPFGPSPAIGAIDVAVPVTLTWTSVGATLGYDVYLGTMSVPLKVASAVPAATYTPALPLAPSTKYWWKIVARNPRGTMTGPLWSFTTRGPPDTPLPVDCVLSAWTLQSATAWGTCVGGQQTRTETWARTVVTPAANGGAACGLLLETRTATQTCVIPVPDPIPTGNTPLTSGVHPRLFISPSTLPVLRAKLGTTFKAEFQTFIGSVNTMPGSGYGGPSIAVITAPLLAYVTYPVPGIDYQGKTADYYASKAKEVLAEIYAVHTDGQPMGGTQMGPVGGFGTLLAYDWLYPVLTATERAKLAAYMKTGQDPDQNNADIFTTQTTYRRAMRIAIAAVLKDGPDDNGFSAPVLARYPAWWTDPTGSFRGESAFAGNTGSYSAQGQSYGMSGHAPTHLLFSELWRGLNDDGTSTSSYTPTAWYLSDNQRFLRRLPEAILFHIHPFATAGNYIQWAGEYVGGRDEMTSDWYADYSRALVGRFKTADPQVAGLAEWLIQNRTGEQTAQSYGQLQRWPLFKFILGDKTTPINPDGVLATKRIFQGDREAGLGNVVLRKSFTGLNDPMVVIQSRRYMGNPFDGPRGPGHFSLDFNGPAIGRQAGAGGHGAGSEMWSHNSLYFPSRDITTPISNDDQGGYRGTGAAITNIDTQWVSGSTNDLRGDNGLVYTALSPTIDYVALNLTRAYSSPGLAINGNPARLSDYRRQFVILWPDAAHPTLRVMVFDRVTVLNPRTKGGTGAIGAENYLHFLGVNLPTLNGTLQPLVRGGNSTAKQTSLDTTEIRARNTVDGSNNETVVTPLLPALGDRRINLIGGPGVDANGIPIPRGAVTSWEQQDAYGARMDPQNPGGNFLADFYYQYFGLGRIEIEASYTTVPTPLRFLTVIEVGTPGFTKTPVALAPTGDAVIIGGQTVTFGTTSATVTGG